MALSGATGITSRFGLAVLNRANACGGQVVDSESGPFTLQLPSTIEVLHDQRDGRFSEDLRRETLTAQIPPWSSQPYCTPKSQSVKVDWSAPISRQVAFYYQLTVEHNVAERARGERMFSTIYW